jgi:hypothetical protein
MKKIEIESSVQIYNAETAVAYAQIINTIVWCQTSDELYERLNVIKQILTVHLHFEWGFGKHHFWLKQRKELRSEELIEDRILIVTF